MLYNQGVIVSEKKFFRNCPSCDKQLGHTNKKNRNKAVKLNKLCVSCSQTGKTMSAEARAKQSAAMTGKTRKPHSAETKAKISSAHKGKTFSAESRSKMSDAHKGVKLSPKHCASMAVSRQKKRDAWTEMYGDKYKFSTNDFKDWGRQVKERDNWTCLRCNTVASGKSIHAHHIVPKEYFMARALIIDNGATLCSSCHQKLHADLNTYVLNGMKLSATDFQNHLKGFINTWPDQKTKQ